MPRTPLEDALWSLGKLDADKQALIDAACRGSQANLPDCLAVALDSRRYALLVWNPLADALPQIMELPRPTGHFLPERPIAQGLVTCFAEDGQKQGDVPIGADPAIVVFGGRTYHLPAALTESLWLSPTAQTFSNVVAAHGATCGPLDLLVKPDGKDALIIDRSQGDLAHVDLGTGNVRQRIRLRTAGKSGGLAVAWAGTNVVVADTAAETLRVYDLRDGEQIDSPAGFGRVTAIQAAKDGHRLYLLTTSPAVALHVVDARTFRPLQHFSIFGDPFSRFGDPCDVLAISDDERQAAVLTSTDDPSPQTPVITLCDLEQGRTLRRVRIPTTRKPAALGFGIANPFHAGDESVESALVRLGIVTDGELAAMQAGLSQAPAASDLPADGPPPADAPPIELSTLAGGDGWRSTVIRAAEPLALPLELEPILAEHLQRTFKERTGIDAQEDEGAWERVLEAASSAREFLEHHSACEIVLPELAPARDLAVLVTREQVQEWLVVLDQLEAALAEAMAEVENAQGSLSAPDRCPNCQTPLLGAYRCPACGHQVQEMQLVPTLPASAKPKDRPKPTSTDHRLFLPPDHLLLADPPRQRVIELDRKGRIIWQIQADRKQGDLQGLLQWPVDALRLANDNTLVIDRVARRVFEVTKEGRPHWEWPAEAGELQEPVRVARNEWGETFVVDRLGHRIWRADANGKPLPGYGIGKPGHGEGQLSSPSDVQALTDGRLIITDTGNHRVVEVADGRIVWQFGDKENKGSRGGGDDDASLHHPRRALRIEAGRTLIVDAGNHRLLIVDRRGRIIWRFDTLSGDERLAMDRPLGAVRMGTDHVVYWDDTCLIEVDRAGAVVWAAQFAQLDANARLEKKAAENRNPEQKSPRRLWEVQRLRDGDPEVTAQAAERERKQQGMRAARKAWFSGDTGPYIAFLKTEIPKRLAEAAEKKVWSIDWKAVERRTKEIRANLDPARRSAVPPEKRYTPPARATAEPAAINPDKRPVEILVVQSARSRVLLLAVDQSVLWQWGENVLSEPHSASLLSPTRALIVDTGNSRIVEVDMTSNDIVWSSPASVGLSYPKCAQRLENGHTLIADTGNRRLVEISAKGEIVWEWRNEEWLQVPTACERTGTGHTLVTDWGNHQVFDVAPDGSVSWSYGHKGSGSKSAGFLNYPEYAHRRPSGHTLIVDGRNNRLLEVDPGGTVSWSYAAEGVKRLSGPTTAQRLGDQTTLVVHGAGRQVFRVNRAGEIIWKTTVPD